jgi:hypothetical protein
MVAAGAHAPRALVERTPASRRVDSDLISSLRERMGRGARAMGLHGRVRIERLHGAGERNAERPVPKVGRSDPIGSCYSRTTLTAVLRDVHGVGNSWAIGSSVIAGGRSGPPCRLCPDELGGVGTSGLLHVFMIRLGGVGG